MEIMHRITITTDNGKIEQILNSMNIQPVISALPGSNHKLFVFDLSESNEYWDDIIQLANKYSKVEYTKNVGIIQTIFSEHEIRNADWLRMKCIFEQGYPQPEGKWPIKQRSFDLKCDNCCTYHQISNFRLKKEPKLGKKNFVKTIWTEEIFCNLEVITNLKNINAKGYEVWDVVSHKTDEPLSSIRQLFVPTIMLPGFEPEDNLRYEVCKKCGQKKYYPHVRGKMKFKHDSFNTSFDFQLTNEWFGTGNFAWREMIVSKRIANLVLDNKWKGISFKVIEVI